MESARPLSTSPKNLVWLLRNYRSGAMMEQIDDTLRRLLDEAADCLDDQLSDNDRLLRENNRLRGV